MMDSGRTTGPRVNPGKRRVITFAVMVMLAAFPIAWLLYDKANKVKAELARYQQPEEPTEELPDDQTTPEEKKFTETLLYNRINISLPNQPKSAMIEVYWHSTTSAYLLIRDLPKLQPGEKFNVWTIAGNKRTSLGLFDAPINGRLIIKAEDVAMSNTYDVKIVME